MSDNIFGTHDENTIVQFREVEQGAVKAALMSDGHFGYIMPVGGVAAYDNMVSVHGNGYDIACGNCAIKTDKHISELGKSPAKIEMMLERIASKIMHNISFGVGRKNNSDDAPLDHPLFSSVDWHRLKERAGHGEWRKLLAKASEQLGTIGSGNHYVDVFTDEEGWLWVGVHFGSRGFGHGVASGFINLAHDKHWNDKVAEAPTLLSLHSSMGQDYWALMNLAGDYAYAGREWVTRKVVEIMGAKEVEMVHNHHNFSWRESHLVDGEMKELIVTRKGATPAFPGQKGFVGGSMGDMSVILEGVSVSLLDDDAKFEIGKYQVDALYSTVHGAGRVMSRTEAAGKRNRKTGELKMKLDEDGKTMVPVKPPKVTPEMMREWIKRENVIVKGGGVDESPHVYRRLPEVLASQRGTVKILHELRPLIVCMAGANEFDPYAD